LEIGIGNYTLELVGVGWNFIYSKTDDAKAWQTGLVTISKQFVGLQTFPEASMSKLKLQYQSNL